MKMRALVATPTALFAGSVGLCKPGRTHGSQQALTVATNAIFIRRGEVENLMGHFYENPLLRRGGGSQKRRGGSNDCDNPPQPPAAAAPPRRGIAVHFHRPW